MTVGAVVAVIVPAGGDPAAGPNRVVTDPYRAADWQAGGRDCPGGRSSGGIADSFGGWQMTGWWSCSP